MIKETSYQWGFVSAGKVIAGGWDTPDRAISAIKARVGEEVYENSGIFRLAQLHVTVEVVTMMVAGHEIKDGVLKNAANRD